MEDNFEGFEGKIIRIPQFAVAKLVRLTLSIPGGQLAGSKYISLHKLSLSIQNYQYENIYVYCFGKENPLNPSKIGYFPVRKFSTSNI